MADREQRIKVLKEALRALQADELSIDEVDIKKPPSLCARVCQRLSFAPVDDMVLAWAILVVVACLILGAIAIVEHWLGHGLLER